MARANTDIQQINTALVLIPLTVASFITLAGVALIMVLKSALLALLALGTLPFLSIAATRFSRRLAPVNLALQEELADVSEVSEETVAGVRVVKGFGAEARQVRRLTAEADSVLDRALDAARLRARFLPLVDFLPTLAMVAILWYGGHLVLDGRLQVGDILAFNLYVLMLIWPLRMAGMLVAQASRASASGGRIHDVLATEPGIADRPGAVALPPGRGTLAFEGVRFGYGPGPAVLNGLDLRIRGGEAVALVGATGSGKTTVARLVPRFYDVEGGRVTLDGVDVRELRLSELRRAVGIVFEDTFLFSGTVDPRLQAFDRVLTLDRSGDGVAVPLDVLSGVRVANLAAAGEPVAAFWVPGTASALDTADIVIARDVGSAVAYRATLDGRGLTFRPGDADETFTDDQTGSTWDVFGTAIEGPLTGSHLEQVFHTTEFWFAWAAFHPDTTLWDGGPAKRNQALPSPTPAAAPSRLLAPRPVVTPAGSREPEFCMAGGLMFLCWQGESEPQ